MNVRGIKSNQIKKGGAGMEYQAAVITVSDGCSAGTRTDTSGPAVLAMLEGAGYRVLHTAVVPDDKLTISRELCRCADELGCDLVLTTGGTGLSSRDVTPEATRAVVHRKFRLSRRPCCMQALPSRPGPCCPGPRRGRGGAASSSICMGP